MKVASKKSVSISILFTTILRCLGYELRQLFDSIRMCTTHIYNFDPVEAFTSIRIGLNVIPIFVDGPWSIRE